MGAPLLSVLPVMEGALAFFGGNGAAMLHGRESTYQLPPHYGPMQENAPADGDTDL